MQFTKGLTANQMGAKKIAQIILSFMNPNWFKPVARYPGNNTSKTSTYNLHKKWTSTDYWPQADVPITLPAPCPALTLPHRTPKNQISVVGFRNLLLRYVAEFKNGSASYTSYRWYSTIGSYDFVVDAPEVAWNRTNIEPGGAVYDGTAFNNTGGTAPLYVAGSFFGNNPPSPSPNKPIHGPLLGTGHFQGHNYVWNDGCTLATPSAVDGQGSLIFIDGIGSDANHNNPDSALIKAGAVSAAQAARTMTGCICIVQGTVPLAPDSTFTCTLYGYNEGEEYEVFGGISGKVTNSQLTGQPLVVIPVTQPDFYRISFAASSASNKVCNIQIIQINNGEMFVQGMTPFVTDHLGEIESDRSLATTLLATNLTPVQTRGGQAVSIQADLGTEWQVPFDSGDAFNWATDEKSEVDMTLVRGHYTPLGVQNEEGMKEMLRQIFPTNTSQRTTGSNSGLFTLRFNLQKREWFLQTLQAPAGDNNVQTMQWTLTTTGEYVGTSQWNACYGSPYTEEQFQQAFKVMKSMPFAYDNPDHTKDLNSAIVAGIGSKMAGQAFPGIISAVKEWAPLVLAALEAAYNVGTGILADLGPVLLPLI